MVKNESDKEWNKLIFIARYSGTATYLRKQYASNKLRARGVRGLDTGGPGAGIVLLAKLFFSWFNAMPVMLSYSCLIQWFKPF